MKPNKDFDKEFFKIEIQFQMITEQNIAEFEIALVKPIQDKFLYAQNHIYDYIVSNDRGKIYNYLKVIAKQKIRFENQKFYEFIVICSTLSKFDKTVETFKPLIIKSKVICVKDS